MCRGCLPTRVRLLDKGVTCPTNCASHASNHTKISCMFSLIVLLPYRFGIGTGLWSFVQHAISITASAMEVIFYLLEKLYV